MKYQILIILASLSCVAGADPVGKYNLEIAAVTRDCGDAKGLTAHDIWYFGQTDVATGKCTDINKKCNQAIGFAVFDNANILSASAQDRLEDLCDMRTNANLCAGLGLWIDKSSEGDVLRTITQFSQGSTRLSTNHSIPMAKILDKDNKFSISADGCFSYEITVKAELRR